MTVSTISDLGLAPFLEGKCYKGHSLLYQPTKLEHEWLLRQRCKYNFMKLINVLNYMSISILIPRRCTLECVGIKGHCINKALMVQRER